MRRETAPTRIRVEPNTKEAMTIVAPHIARARTVLGGLSELLSIAGNLPVGIRKYDSHDGSVVGMVRVAGRFREILLTVPALIEDPEEIEEFIHGLICWPTSADCELGWKRPAAIRGDIKTGVCQNQYELRYTKLIYLYNGYSSPTGIAVFNGQEYDRGGHESTLKTPPWVINGAARINSEGPIVLTSNGVHIREADVKVDAPGVRVFGRIQGGYCYINTLGNIFVCECDTLAQFTQWTQNGQISNWASEATFFGKSVPPSLAYASLKNGKCNVTALYKEDYDELKSTTVTMTANVSLSGSNGSVFHVESDIPHTPEYTTTVTSQANVLYQQDDVSSEYVNQV